MHQTPATTQYQEQNLDQIRKTNIDPAGKLPHGSAIPPNQVNRSCSRSHQRASCDYERKWLHIPLLSCGVPNLGLDDLAIDLEAAVANSTPMGAELLGEVREQVGLADAEAADDHRLEQVVVVVVQPVRASPTARHFLPRHAGPGPSLPARSRLHAGEESMAGAHGCI